MIDYSTAQEDSILVTGGAGFIGKCLVSYLAERGKTVVSIYHHRLLNPIPNVYPVCSDLQSPQLLAAPLRGIKTVIFLAWENNFQGPKEEPDFDTHRRDGSPNIRFLANMIEAMETAGTKRLIFLSALGASRQSSNPFLKEKYFGEFYVLNSKIPEKIIIRSSIVLSEEPEEDRFLTSIRGLMRLPWLYPIPKVNGRISPIQMRELCQLIEKYSNGNHSVSGSVIEAKGNREYTVEQFFESILNRYEGGGKLQVRGFLGKALIHFLEKGAREPHFPRIMDYLALGPTNIESNQSICSATKFS